MAVVSLSFVSVIHESYRIAVLVPGVCERTSPEGSGTAVVHTRLRRCADTRIPPICPRTDPWCAHGTASLPDMGNPLVARMQGFGTTIFAEMSALALSTGAINLGQGFPDTDGPREMLEAAIDAINSGRNQYPPGAGVPELLDAIAEHQRRFYGLTVDPAHEVLVTAGATEAIASSSSGTPAPGGYWLRPELIASIAASSISRGPSVSGKPCPRLIAPVLSASALISAKIVVPNPCIRATSGFPMSGRLAVP